MNIAEPAPIESSDSSSLTAVRAACALIPPLFNLENFVAVNPFLGWSSTPLAEASAQISSGLDAEVLPSLEHYRKAWQRGEIDSEDIDRAAARYGVHPGHLFKALAGHSSVRERMAPTRELESERVFREFGINLPRILTRFVSRSLADMCSQPFAKARQPMAAQQLYQELMERAAIDRSFELSGISGWRKWIRAAPSSYLEAIAWSFGKRADLFESEAYVYRLLGSQYGWASALRGICWSSDPSDFELLEGLCAALLVFDVAFAELVPSEQRSSAAHRERESDSLRLCLQDAYEDRLVKSQLSRFSVTQQSPSPERLDFQVLLCIDVRSEVMRRKLEALSSRVETVGFAGFFGVAVDYVSEETTSPRCPVLLKPQIGLQAERKGLSARFQPVLRTAFSSPGSFSLIETAGLGYVGALLAKASALLRKGRNDEGSVAATAYTENHFGLTLAERVALAESILRNSGIGNRLGKVVVLCGHGGHSSNNAHAASLDCGACGGHCGALNAQMAVEVLNDAPVREELDRRGYSGIGDALFLAAVHDTSTDSVSVFQRDTLSESQGRMVTRLQAMLTEASEACRKERAQAMGIDVGADQNLLDLLERRANDWSEVRPEWGLARNASFIAAPRFRTRGADLEGRAFLHDYDAASDTDDSVLKLILSAPVVVASWINLQYFASTVDNERFGCGTKALLNRIGTIGVISGNEGDLRPGLPIESVHRPDGGWFHDPVRLQVIVEAPMSKIDRVLDQLPAVEELVSNGWIRLLALEPSSGAVHLRRADGTWEEFRR